MDRNNERYLCLHLHFYQPPRENPWLGEIEYQESAYPFHDWNERIDMECYRANGESRILDGKGRVIDLANNYAKTSFNFGPTLLSWMEEKDPVTYQKILDGDRLSQTYFGGHGNAIAQAYNHIIMPLANARDKETQVLWGLMDFERRFGRKAEAMWLPETAVDTATLEMLAKLEMKYVILAPRQAKAVRVLGKDEEWKDVANEQVDTTEPYMIRLPSGGSIAAFFYDGPISKAVAFEGLLHNGETFANRLLSGFRDSKKSTQLLHIATDGETYGHHHRQGDMALAYALHHIEKNNLAVITNYGQYLELNPPKQEAQIHEESSWSCAHGIERWRSDCGCNSGMKGNWRQTWREPLRHALDQVRDALEKPFEEKMREFGVSDPWAARNDYLRVVQDRSLANIDAYLAKWTGNKELKDSEASLILKALEVQHHLLLMYTSCGWFFDEVSGIETIQNLQYAYRAIELAQSVFGLDLLEPFMAELEKAHSNLPELSNGRTAFERYVMPARVDTLRVGTHFAVASVFDNFGSKNEVYNNKITLLEFSRFSSGKARFACGHARIRSRTTLERHHIMFGVIHLGDHNVSAGIKRFESKEQYETLLNDARAAFGRADFPETIRVLDRHFGSSTSSLKDLFKDEQMRILDMIISGAVKETEERLARLYENNYPLLSYLSNLSAPIPKVFSDVAEFVQNRGIRKALNADARVNTETIRGYLDEAKRWRGTIDIAGFNRDLEKVIERKMVEFEIDDQNMERLSEVLDLVRLEKDLPTAPDLGPIQNRFFLWYRNHAAKKAPLKEEGKSDALESTAQALAQILSVKLPSDNSSDKSAENKFSAGTENSHAFQDSNVSNEKTNQEDGSEAKSDRVSLDLSSATAKELSS